MLIVHDKPKGIEVPLERLKFARDPLGFNSDEHLCQCFGCRFNRLAAEHGPAAAIKTLFGEQALAISMPFAAAVLAPKQEAASPSPPPPIISDVAAGGTSHEAETPHELRGPLPEEVAQSTPAPLITAFDTNRDGTPRVPPEPARQLPIDTPERVIGVQGMISRAVAFFRRFIHRQPRLRVLKEE